LIIPEAGIFSKRINFKLKIGFNSPQLAALTVIPAKAGIQKNKAKEWIPAFAGMTVSPNCYKIF